MLTGEFLVKKSFITQEVLDKAIEIQTKQRIPIGTLAVQNQFLTEEQLILILKKLRTHKDPLTDKNPSVRFGDIGIELGILSSDEVVEIKRIQDSKTPLIGNVLVQMEAITSRVFVKALRDFKKLNG